MRGDRGSLPYYGDRESGPRYADRDPGIPDGGWHADPRPPSERRRDLEEGFPDDPWREREAERKSGYSRQFPEGHQDRPEWTWDRDFRQPKPYVSQGGRATFPEAAPGPHVGKGPKGYRRPDDQIREEANQRLERDGRVDASEIEVSCQEGVLTLQGKVEDRRARRAAEDCVDDIRGVKDVMNELTIDQEAFRHPTPRAESPPTPWPGEPTR